VRDVAVEKVQYSYGDGLGLTRK